MARVKKRSKPTRQLTEAELRIMNVLWSKARATVSELTKAIDANPPLAYSTVLTTVRILESKGFIRHDKEARAFVYYPVVARDEARSGALKHLLSRFFNNSPELLLANLIENRQISEKELERLKKMIAEQN